MIENIVKTFATDLMLSRVENKSLEVYQCKKHGWSTSQWLEYFQIFVDNIDKIEISLKK